MANTEDSGSDDEFEHPNQPPEASKGKAKAPDPHAPPDVPPVEPPPQPAIKLLKTKNYSNVSKIAKKDHLANDNWHEWKECNTSLPTVR